MSPNGRRKRKSRKDRDLASWKRLAAESGAGLTWRQFRDRTLEALAVARKLAGGGRDEGFRPKSRRKKRRERNMKKLTGQPPAGDWFMVSDPNGKPEQF